MQETAINWFEIHVEDFQRATAFYEKILNKTMQPASMPGCNMNMFPVDPSKGVGGALVKMEGFQAGPGGTVVYLNVGGDLDGVIERIPGAGGKVIRPRMDISPHGFIAIFQDSEGNIVGLHSMT